MAIVLDGHNSAQASTNSGGPSGNATDIAVAITTTQTDDIIVVGLLYEHITLSVTNVASVSDTHGLTWTRRDRQVVSDTAGPTGITQYNEIWWAHAPTAITTTITATFSVTPSAPPPGFYDDAVIIAMGFSGVDTTTPFDTNGSLPAHFIPVASETTYSATISTTSSNDMILFFAGADTNKVIYANPKINGLAASPGLVEFQQNNGGANWEYAGGSAGLATGALSSATVSVDTNGGPALNLITDIGFATFDALRPGGGPHTITQAAPFSDTVLVSISGEYVNHINVTGNVGVVTFSTPVQNQYLTVSPQGVIATNGVVPVGSYTITGTMSDNSGGTGTWTFTLTVTTGLLPQAKVTATQQTLPTGSEIQVPFHIDPATGGVATLIDYAAIVAQHLATVIMTITGERVMLPLYGSGVQGAVFEPINNAQNAVLSSNIKQALNTWEPAVNIVKVQVGSTAQNPAQLNVVVEFRVDPYPTVNTVAVSVGGTIQQVNAP